MSPLFCIFLMLNGSDSKCHDAGPGDHISFFYLPI